MIAGLGIIWGAPTIRPTRGPPRASCSGTIDICGPACRLPDYVPRALCALELPRSVDYQQSPSLLSEEMVWQGLILPSWNQACYLPLHARARRCIHMLAHMVLGQLYGVSDWAQFLQWLQLAPWQHMKQWKYWKMSRHSWVKGQN